MKDLQVTLDYTAIAQWLAYANEANDNNNPSGVKYALKKIARLLDNEINQEIRLRLNGY